MELAIYSDGNSPYHYAGYETGKTEEKHEFFAFPDWAGMVRFTRAEIEGFAVEPSGSGGTPVECPTWLAKSRVAEATVPIGKFWTAWQRQASPPQDKPGNPS